MANPSKFKRIFARARDLDKFCPGFKQRQPQQLAVENRKRSQRVRAGTVSLSRCARIYDPLVARFGDEYTVFIEAPEEEMFQIIDPRIAEAIVGVRKRG